MKKASIRWMTNACFEISGCGATIVTDPCLSLTSCKEFDEKSFGKVDYIILSHLHWDHVSELKAMVRQYGSTVLCGAQGSMPLAEYLDINPSCLYPMYPGQSLDMGAVAISCLYNRHANVALTFSQQRSKCTGYDFIKRFPGLDKLQAIGGMEMNSYLLAFENGFKVLFWGGDITQSQKTMLRGLQPDVALMQFSRQTPESLAELAEAIKPGVLIPHHHDLRTLLSECEEKLSLLRQCYNGNLMCPRNGENIDF